MHLQSNSQQHSWSPTSPRLGLTLPIRLNPKRLYFFRLCIQMAFENDSYATNLTPPEGHHRIPPLMRILPPRIPCRMLGLRSTNISTSTPRLVSVCLKCPKSTFFQILKSLFLKHPTPETSGGRLSTLFKCPKSKSFQLLKSLFPKHPKPDTPGGRLKGWESSSSFAWSDEITRLLLPLNFLLRLLLAAVSESVSHCNQGKTSPSSLTGALEKQLEDSPTHLPFCAISEQKIFRCWRTTTFLLSARPKLLFLGLKGISRTDQPLSLS